MKTPIKLLICLLPITFFLSGCASQVTSSTGRTVIVRAGIPDMGVDSALALAEIECKKKGLAARIQAMTSPMSDRYIFECVRT
jgi:hypothetical protein